MKNSRIRAAVTYGFNGGRFGDNLLSYLHAKWVSFKYRIPLLYKQFPYSDQLRLHKLEQRYGSTARSEFDRHKVFEAGDRLSIDRFSSTLYEIPYFPESKQEYQSNLYFYFPVEWDNEEFKAEMRKYIAPTKTLNLPGVPKYRVSVAVHVRRNSNGYDPPLSYQSVTRAGKRVFVDHLFPLKHPSDEFYLEQLSFLARYFHPKRLYVFVFTDDTRPKQIVKKYEESISLPGIQFACRVQGNSHIANVLRDFFAMTRFDCLIRPDSNFSLVASKLGDYRMMIAPSHSIQQRDRIRIDQVTMEMRAK